MIHYLTLGHLDLKALRGCAAVATLLLDESMVRCAGRVSGCRGPNAKDGYVVLPWHGLGSVAASEALALRLHELTGCLIADQKRASDRATGTFPEDEGGGLEMIGHVS